MKNTINISLGGIVFHIEEDAHQKLSAYLEAISNSMQGSEGQSEIMADIEARLAELLQPKVTSYKQVISITDVEEVIAIMGKPEEFATGNTEAKKEEPINTNERGRYQYGQRRIFRDPDDKILGGVCSGLAYHFGIDPIWMRLGFGLSFFLWGFSLIIYILLLIIIPKARTAAEKLEMRGQPIDINNIRKIVEEDMEDIKKRAKEFGEDMKNWRTRSRGQRFERNVGDFFASLGHGVGSVVGGIVKGISIFIGLILIIVFASLLIALIVSLSTGMNVIHIEGHNGHMISYSVNNLLTMFDLQGTERTLLILGIFMFLGIPLMSLIVRIVRAFMGRRRPFQWYNVTASILWSAAWIFIIIGIAKISQHFKVPAHVSDEAKFTLPAPEKTLYLKIPVQNYDDDISIGINSHSFYVSDDTVFFGNPLLCLSPSPDTNFHFILNKSARGNNSEEAKASANNIEYSFTQHDSVLQLSPYYQLHDGAAWRMQKLEGILEIPVNKSVDLPEGIDHFICSSIHHKHHHLGGRKWVMSANGIVDNDNNKSLKQ